MTSSGNLKSSRNMFAILTDPRGPLIRRRHPEDGGLTDFDASARDLDPTSDETWCKFLMLSIFFISTHSLIRKRNTRLSNTRFREYSENYMMLAGVGTIFCIALRFHQRRFWHQFLTSPLQFSDYDIVISPPVAIVHKSTDLRSK